MKNAVPSIFPNRDEKPPAKPRVDPEHRRQKQLILKENFERNFFEGDAIKDFGNKNKKKK